MGKPLESDYNMSEDMWRGFIARCEDERKGESRDFTQVIEILKYYKRIPDVFEYLAVFNDATIRRIILKKIIAILLNPQTANCDAVKELFKGVSNETLFFDMVREMYALDRSRTWELVVSEAVG